MSLVPRVENGVSTGVKDASWIRDQHAETLESEVMYPAPTQVLAQSSLSEVQVQAQLLACVSLQGLNRDRAKAVIKRAAEPKVGPMLVHGGQSAASEPLVRLAEAALHAVGVVACPMTCHVSCVALQDIVACVEQMPGQVCLLLPLPLHVPKHVGAIWVPLNRGSLIQGELVPQPGNDPAAAPVGQSCAIEAWRGLWLTNVASCCLMQPSAEAEVLALLFAAAQCLSLPLPSVSPPVEHRMKRVGLPSAPVGPQSSPVVHEVSRARLQSEPGLDVLLPAAPKPSNAVHLSSPAAPQPSPVVHMSSRAVPQPSMSATAVAPASFVTPQRPSHELHSWRESPLSSCREQQVEEGGKRWYRNIPMPEVEPVDKELLYENDDEVCK